MEKKFTVADVILYIVLFFVNVITIYPVLLTLFKSLSSAEAVMAGKVNWYPVEVNMRAYALFFRERLLARSYINTVLYAFVHAALMLSLTSLAGYVLSIKEFSFKNIFTILFVIPMYFGGGMIPFYLLIKSLGLINTIWSITLPAALGGYSIFIFRTFFQSIPDSMRESAIIDGAGEFRVLSRIILPLSKPLLATFALFSIVGMWNSFFGPLIFLSSPEKMPLQIVLRRLLIQDDLSTLRTEAARQMAQATADQKRLVPESIKSAAIIVSITPILILYPFLQKYFVKGMMIGAIKG